MKKIEETKCTCISCGHIWCYGMKEVLENASNSPSNSGKDMMMCCGGYFPALENAINAIFSAIVDEVTFQTCNTWNCCCGCGGGGWHSRDEIPDKFYNYCAKCGSHAIKKENVIHEVE